MDLFPRAAEEFDGWPFGSTGYKEGFYRKNHTSTATLVYTTESMPVPWPWMLFSMVISMLVACWGYYSTVKHKRQDERNSGAGSEGIRAKVTFGIFILTTIRSVATFILAVKAYLPSHQRYPPQSAIAALMISAISSALDCGLLPRRYWRAVVKRVAQLNAWLCFASLVMMMVLPFIRKSFVYGKYVLTGGHCPVVVWDCPYQPSTIGCPDPSLSNSERAAYWVASYKDIYGLVLFLTHLTPSELSCSVLAIIVGAYITVSGFRLVSWGRDMVEYALNFRQEKERRKTREAEANSEELYFVGAVHKPEKPRPPIRKDASVFILLAIFIFAAVSVPLHAVQEALPKKTIVSDAFGPADKARRDWEGPRFREQMQKGYSGENNNGTSWLDCYTVTAPADITGFMGDWIEVQKGEPLTFLAML